MNKNLLTIAASVLLSAAAAFGVIKATSSSKTSQGGILASYNGTSITDPSAYRTVNLANTDYPDFTYAAESCVDAVVYVEVTTVSQSRRSYEDPLFFFFGYGQQAQPREQKGSGSGVIIRSDGYIVTNNHVVQGATQVKVTLNSNQTYDATVIGSDPVTDIALIKVDAENLPTVPVGDSDELRLGEWVLAIGSPYGLRSTVTAGIVSAKGRSMQSSNEEFKIESFIQTDAAVNPGNSGGALVNKKGELVGINTMIYSQTGSFAGYSFAVPVTIMKKIVADLIDFGSVKRAMLGISMSAVDETIAKEKNLKAVKGVIVRELTAGGAAEKAGIKVDDVITMIDNTEITSASSVQEKVNSYRPGDKAVITVVRYGKEQNVNVTFQESATTAEAQAEDGTAAFYGAKIKEASESTLSKFRIKNGVEIVSIGEGKLKQAGAREGFIILYVNDTPVHNAQEVIDLAKKSKRAIYVEGISANGRPSYFAFGKDE